MIILYADEIRITASKCQSLRRWPRRARPLSLRLWRGTVLTGRFRRCRQTCLEPPRQTEDHRLTGTRLLCHRPPGIPITRLSPGRSVHSGPHGALGSFLLRRPTLRGAISRRGASPPPGISGLPCDGPSADRVRSGAGRLYVSKAYHGNSRAKFQYATRHDHCFDARGDGSRSCGLSAPCRRTRSCGNGSVRTGRDYRFRQASRCRAVRARSMGTTTRLPA